MKNYLYLNYARYVMRIILLILLLPMALSVPQIYSVSGGSSLFITGSGFGTGPNVLIFDDFEKGQDGQPIMTGNSAVGGWDYVQRSDETSIYSSAASVSGELSFRADQIDSWPEGQQTIVKNFPDGTTEFFISYWTYIPPNDRFPGDGTTDGSNWKVIWAMGSDTTDDDLTIPTRLGTSSLITCNECAYTRWMEFGVKKGEWKRVWAWVKGRGDNTGAVHYWELGDGVEQKVADDNVQVFNNLGDSYEQININGYGRTTPDCHPTFDDVYIATGANAQARIEIGNNQAYEESTKLTIAVPTSWSSNSIEAEFFQGMFEAGEQAYVFVFDNDGNHNNLGYPVIIGSEETGVQISSVSDATVEHGQSVTISGQGFGNKQQ